MQSILDKIAESSDMIIIDSPPALAVTDSLVMVPYVDAVLIVIKPGFTKAKKCPFDCRTIQTLQCESDRRCDE